MIENQRIKYMSSIAHNSFILTHLIDSRTGRVTSEEARLLVQQVRPRDTVGSMGPRPAGVGVVVEKVPLPTAKKSGAGTEDVYAELAEAFGEICIVMGRVMGGQSAVFAAEQQDNTIMAKSMLQAQENQISQQKQIDAQIQKIEDEQAAEEKQSKILNIVGLVAMGVMLVAAPLAVAIAPALSAAWASVTAAETTVAAADAGMAGGEAIELGDMAAQGAEDA